jgi:hypothetical protein
MKIYDKAIELYKANVGLHDPHQSREEHNIFAAEVAELKTWLVDQIDVSKAKFKRYLTITE